MRRLWMEAGEGLARRPPGIEAERVLGHVPADRAGQAVAVRSLAQAVHERGDRVG